jgi:hypothetical protein
LGTNSVPVRFVEIHRRARISVERDGISAQYQIFNLSGFE